MEAALDFPEEAGELPPASVQERLDRHAGSLKALAETYEAGRLLREGLLVVIAGRPNVGKSSLLNRLLDRERAIVTEIPGTTRDLVEESITLGVVVRLSDTAGLRPAQDRREESGIERTRERLQQADLVLYLVDASAPGPGRWGGPGGTGGETGPVVTNKIDLPGGRPEAESSGKPRRPRPKSPPRPARASRPCKRKSSPRPWAAVSRWPARSSPRPGTMSTSGNAWRIWARPVKCWPLRPAPGNWWPWNSPSAIHALGEITGEEVGEAILDRIFGQFCLGK